MRIETIGNATLYLGDCQQILPAINAAAAFTDPPYGIRWSKPGLPESAKRNASRPHEGIANDQDTTARDKALRHFDRAVVFGSLLAPFPERTKQCLIWHKPGDSGVFGAVAGYRRDVEAIFLVGNWEAAGVERSSVLRASAHFRGQIAAESGSHPHAKPVDLMEKLIAVTDIPIICDPFMGSGTTGVACAHLGRRFVGIEIDPEYFRIACGRISAAYAQGRLFA